MNRRATPSSLGLCALQAVLVCVVTFAVMTIGGPVAYAQAGQTCHAFKKCPKGFHCMPFRQKCHRDGGAIEGEPCQAGYGCAGGFTCEAGSQVCRGPGREGDSCHLTRPCGAGLTCEAGSHKCRAPGKVGQSCHATRPCSSGLSCQPGVHQCYHSPRLEGEPCVAGHPCGPGLNCEAGSQTCRKPGQYGDSCHTTRPCAEGLSCQPGSQKCYHKPRRPGEPCSLGFGCGTKGFECKAVVQRCLPEKLDLDSGLACAAMYAEELSTGARNAKSTMSFGVGSTAAAGGFVSDEMGTVYGEGGQFGCYVMGCYGAVTDVQISNYASFGLFNSWNDFAGQAIVTSQGASIPFIEVGGFNTGQVLDLHGKFIGSVNSISIGVGLSPVQIGGVSCHTFVIDAQQGLTTLKGYEEQAKQSAKSGSNNIPTASVTNPAAGGASPGTATHAAGSQCFWLNGQNNQWQAMAQLRSKEQCFDMDSCSGGRGRSGGGCYKWAASAHAAAEPWPQASASAGTSANAATQPASGQCFWLNAQNNQWQAMAQLRSKEQCFDMDSCSGGRGRSGGGCYKWAASAHAAAEPW